MLLKDQRIMNKIEVGVKVTKRAPGIIIDGVITRVDLENRSAGVMWRIEGGGILVQAEPFDNLVLVVQAEGTA